MSGTDPAQSTERTSAVPVLIYAGGLANVPENSAAAVADVIAAVIDRRRPGRYASTTNARITAPRGLKVGKTVTDQAGTPVLQVFELDYRPRFQSPRNAAGPPPSPGVVRSSLLALRATFMLLGALRRGAKTAMAKFQLAIALLAVCALIFAAVVAIVAALVSVGVGVPDAIEDVFDGDTASATFAVLGLTTVLAWSAVRRWLLAIAVTVQQTLGYIDNEDRHSDSVTLTVDIAVDGLRDSGWTGGIHLLGYSFGSLVVFDAMFPPSHSRRTADAVTAVRSITTIGCPLDAVRLFRPSYAADRDVRVPAAPWCNVFIATDVFGSNLQNGDDSSADGSSVVGIAGVETTSIRYLDDELTWGAVLKMKGFRSHAGYWGGPDEGSCFDILVDQWCAPDAAPASDPSG
jgi:hypothetical protein